MSIHGIRRVIAVGLSWSVPALLLAMLPLISRADLAFTVTLNTSVLAGPFSLDFQLVDGSGLGDGNNTVMLSNFNFGGGSAVGLPTLAGMATGSAGAGFSLKDSTFFNEVIQKFNPGSTLSFDVKMTTNAGFASHQQLQENV